MVLKSGSSKFLSVAVVGYHFLCTIIIKKLVSSFNIIQSQKNYYKVVTTTYNNKTILPKYPSKTIFALTSSLASSASSSSSSSKLFMSTNTMKSNIIDHNNDELINQYENITIDSNENSSNNCNDGMHEVSIDNNNLEMEQPSQQKKQPPQEQHQRCSSSKLRRIAGSKSFENLQQALIGWTVDDIHNIVDNYDYYKNLTTPSATNTDTNTNTTIDISGKGPLHAAAWKGSIENVQYLIETIQCNINQIATGQYCYGKTPIFFAITRERNDIIQYLLQMGAHVKIVNNKGQTLVSIASSHSNITQHTIQLLQQAEINQTNIPWINYRLTHSDNLVYGDLDPRFIDRPLCNKSDVVTQYCINPTSRLSRNSGFVRRNPTIVLSEKQKQQQQKIQKQNQRLQNQQQQQQQQLSLNKDGSSIIDIDQDNVVITKAWFNIQQTIFEMNATNVDIASRQLQQQYTLLESIRQIINIMDQRRSRWINDFVYKLDNIFTQQEEHLQQQQQQQQLLQISEQQQQRKQQEHLQILQQQEHQQPLYVNYDSTSTTKMAFVHYLDTLLLHVKEEEYVQTRNDKDINTDIDSTTPTTSITEFCDREIILLQKIKYQLLSNEGNNNNNNQPENGSNNRSTKNTIVGTTTKESNALSSINSKQHKKLIQSQPPNLHTNIHWQYACQRVQHLHISSLQNVNVDDIYLSLPTQSLQQQDPQQQQQHEIIYINTIPLMQQLRSVLEFNNYHNNDNASFINVISNEYSDTSTTTTATAISSKEKSLVRRLVAIDTEWDENNNISTLQIALDDGHTSYILDLLECNKCSIKNNNNSSKSSIEGPTTNTTTTSSTKTTDVVMNSHEQVLYYMECQQLIINLFKNHLIIGFAVQHDIPKLEQFVNCPLVVAVDQNEQNRRHQDEDDSYNNNNDDSNVGKLIPIVLDYQQLYCNETQMPGLASCTTKLLSSLTSPSVAVEEVKAESGLAGGEPTNRIVHVGSGNNNNDDNDDKCNSRRNNILTLNKEQQCSKWGQRPLTTKQIKYAALDAVILLYLLAEKYRQETKNHQLQFIENIE